MRDGNPDLSDEELRKKYDENKAVNKELEEKPKEKPIEDGQGNN